MRAVKEWFRGLGTWLRMFLPSQRAAMLKRVYLNGVRHGKRDGQLALLQQIANMNRDMRRGYIKDVVKEYKEQKPE